MTGEPPYTGCMRVTLTAMTGLLYIQGLASTWPPVTPLTAGSLAAWLKQVCAQATCVQVRPQTLIPTHAVQVFPESRAYVITKAGQSFILLHDFAPHSGQVPLQELTFMPSRLSDRWTSARLNTVAEWLNRLAGGNVTADVMVQCVARLKRSASAGQTLDPSGQGKGLNFLATSDQDTATGSCVWLPGNRNVGFGFTGKGRY